MVWSPTSVPQPALPPSHAEASIGLVTLNSKYVHTALSLRYLRNAARAAGFAHTWIAEYTIQTPLWKAAAELMARRPAVLGFSVYIWNRRQTLDLIELVKKQQPQVLIVVGGPEVSFEAGPPSPYVDVVIAGEGERKWAECLGLWAESRRPDAATLRRWATYGTDLPALEALPYLDEDLPQLAERLVYVETSRGCPYTCSFCLSALDESVRFYPDAAVKAHLERLIGAGARRIKFLDRTFNLRKARVRELFRWLMGFPGVEFHFEVVGDLLDDAMLALLAEAQPGMFQFEIGVQSALEPTRARVERRQHQPRLFEVIRRLVNDARVHLHVDLIWGLPGETLADIRASFEQVLALQPHELQLGFLKFLPGAPIRGLIEPHRYVFQDAPPYEVIAHADLAADAVLALKRFAEVFDLYYNSGHFRFTLRRLMQVRPAWEVFEALAAHFAAEGLLLPAHGLEGLLGHLQRCARDWLPEAELADLLKLDYFFHHRARRVPRFLNGHEAAETPAVRAHRKREPHSAVAAFAHRLELRDGAVELTPSAEPVWFAFRYPPTGEGYFFRPQVERLPD
ncbi:MAG TPA: DUF4080 domain-containing protein [bacterium]|nr:DUF4080 domain-containing protein [bacterium]